MDNLIETYERNGLTINILLDSDPESPREWDNVGTMVCAHRSYTLGDEQFSPSDYDGWDDLKKHLIKDEKAAVILPLSLYDHSGLRMLIGEINGWDSGQIGFIYCTQKKLDEEFNGDKKAAELCLKCEVGTYDTYLRGDIYGYEVVNPKDGEVIDSCWGFYGIESVREEANDVADNFKRPRDAKYAKRASELHA